MRIIDVKEFGAVGDGKTKNTAALQSAINACAKAGGGRVEVADGTYLTGALKLASFVELHLEANAVLLGSPDIEDYPLWKCHHMDADKLPRGRANALIFAEECENVAITGRGVIDGNGSYFVRPSTEHLAHWKPYVRIDGPIPPRVIFLAGCNKARVEDITVRNTPAGWALFIHDCDDVAVTRICIKSRLDYPNNDGIHINCSRDITVSDCNITASDDAIIVRANNMSLPENKVCERVTVSNCNLISHCGAIRIGWLNDGIMRNCSFSNLTITDTRNIVLITLPWRGPDRIPDEGREATHIENLSFDNIVADRIYGMPIRIKVDDHENTRVTKGVIRGIYFHGIHSRAQHWPSIEARADFPVENLSISDSSFEKIPDSEFQGQYEYRRDELLWDEAWGDQMFSHVKNLFMTNTTFTETEE